ncbi:MAG TPA: ornithine carbamoyltransferase [Spirochaetota bacterium]|nr:ornithine carbamoyltransferase [Spirochaetota bacterium]HNT10575.1 ornithine carbamoyltransferase [Spirochaetota bacterium]
MKIPSVAAKDLLTVTDLTRQEMLEIFKFSAKLKKETLAGKRHKFLEGLTLAMIFEKSSTRTRVSFETGIFQLGGYALFLSKGDIQLARGETVADTARVLSGYVDGIMVRAYEHGTLIDLARTATVPVINGLTDLYHPCQALTDYFTIFERDPAFPRIKLTYVGDGNNMAHSLLLCGAILGADVAIASPKEYTCDRSIIERAFSIASSTGSRIDITTNIDQAVAGAQYLYTDVWVSMGQEKGAAKRKKALSRYTITMPLLNKAAPGCRVMHCLPAHRGEEITDEVLASNRSIVFEQAENRLHLQKGLMCAFMSKHKLFKK